MVDFNLPDIGEGLSEAELLEWTVKVGDRVREGDEVAMISTDKVNVDLTAPASGLVTELHGSPGDIIEVGTLIMRIDDGSSSEQAVEQEEAAVAANSPGSPVAVQSGNAVRAAPIVRRYAAEKGVDLARVNGTGPGGQVTRSDIDTFLAAQTGPSFSGQQMKLAGPRLAAAQRLAQADRLQVTSTISFEVQADSLLDHLQRLSAEAEAASVRLTPTVLIAERLAQALARHPKFNATINEDDGALLMHDSVNLGLAVDTEDGLMVPVIPQLEEKSPLEIAAAVAQTADQARTGGLGLDDMQGSTFTLSSTGSLEQATITSTTPVINYPNVATLWISRISERARVIDGKLGVGPMMACSLSFDHRYLHGADGMAFINDLVAALVQAPA
jgi:pyruvate/2-oxoglutarate dehydrogenase complex dihydrolipoamide acyltransferase (E2) component